MTRGDGGGRSANHATPSPPRVEYVPPTTQDQEDNMQGKRTKALDSRGRPVPGLYTRDGRFIAGFRIQGRWHMRNLAASTLTEARRERNNMLAGMREGRIAAPAQQTFADAFVDYQDSRRLSERTIRHERHLRDRHLRDLADRRVQDVTSRDVASVLRGMRDTYSEWTCVAVYQILNGTFALAVRRGTLTRNPVDGLASAEKPRQRNQRKVAVLDAETLDRLVSAGGSERWVVALALAGYGGLRLGELRALVWGDVDLDAGAITVRRSMLPNGTVKSPKTQAGERTIPILPTLRRALVTWRLKSPWTEPSDFVVCTATGAPVQERNLRRALDAAKATANLDGTADRLSWHSLRHSFASMLATDLELPVTTLAEIIGHANAGFTLRVYARDGRDRAKVIEDVLARAREAGIGG